MNKISITASGLSIVALTKSFLDLVAYPSAWIEIACRRRLAVSLLLLFSPVALGETNESKFIAELKKMDERIAELRIEYRKAIAERLRLATHVELYIVDFDVLAPAALADIAVAVKDPIAVEPYGMVSNIVVRKTIQNPNERTQLLAALAAQITIPRHSGGALCHSPIHGLRAYDKDGLIIETTFSWTCRNFGFKYPRDSQLLDTSDGLNEIANRLLPVPSDMMERLKDK